MGVAVVYIFTNGEHISTVFETREEAEEFLANSRDSFSSCSHEVLFMPGEFLLRYKDVAAIRITPEWTDIE